MVDTCRLVRTRATVLSSISISIIGLPYRWQKIYRGTMISGGGHCGKKEDSESIHDFSRSNCIDLNMLPKRWSKNYLMYPISEQSDRHGMQVPLAVLWGPWSSGTYPRSLDILAVNRTSSRLFDFGHDRGGVVHASGRCQHRCLHIRRPVHVDQAHVGKPDFPTFPLPHAEKPSDATTTSSHGYLNHVEQRAMS